MLPKLILFLTQILLSVRHHKVQGLAELLLVAKVEGWFRLSSILNTAAARPTFCLKQETGLKPHKLLRKESSIKMVRLATDSTLKANSWVREALLSATNSWDVIIRKSQQQKLYWSHLCKEAELNKNWWVKLKFIVLSSM